MSECRRGGGAVEDLGNFEIATDRGYDVKNNTIKMEMFMMFLYDWNVIKL